MSLVPKAFRGRHEPHGQLQSWDSFQDHGLLATRGSSTTIMAFQGEPYSPMVNGHIEWKDTPEAHVYKANLPSSLKHSDVRVEVDDGKVLCINCEKRVEKQQHRGGVHHVQFSSGLFVQRLNLPENSKVDQVKASMDNKNGVLTITVPKNRVMNRNVRNIEITHK
ncbi:hypothetical protein RIF29_30334 [Crotalaria pallida]|uniref:SHSP domain-containing protein n=1 Tax=Crotalaria pallida TaxID=3830 RepID=A0AAN9EMX5_CROPI